MTLGYGAVIPETADFTRIFCGAATGATAGTGVIPMNDENTPKEKEVKRRFQSWLRPSTIRLMDRLYEDDNCKSRSEFIEKAVRFYAGYLSTQNAREYLPNVVISTLKSIAELNAKLVMLEQLRSKGYLAIEVYQSQTRDIQKQISSLKSERRSAFESTIQTMLDEVLKMRSLLNEIEEPLEEFNDKLFHELVKGIEINKQDEMTVTFLGGLKFTELI